MHRSLEPILDEIDFTIAPDKMHLEDALIFLRELDEQIKSRMQALHDDIEVKAKSDH